MYIPKGFTEIAAYAVATLILMTLRHLAIRIGLVDSPDNRKLHQGQIPLIGGIGMFGGFVFAAVLLSISLQPYRTLFAASGLLVFLGILDDFHELSPRSRLVGQLLAALFLTWGGGLLLQNLGNILGAGDIMLPLWLSWIVTILAIPSVINAMNIMDGLDGLAGLLALVATASLLILTLGAGDLVTASLIGLLCAVIIAFLQFNWRLMYSSRVFMGDAGSMFLGLAFVWFAIYCSQAPHASIRPVTMLWVLAIPLCELLTVFLFRLSQRRSPLKAGRDHMHYLLVQYSQWPIWCVVLLLAIVASILAAIGVLSEKLLWPEYIMFYGFLAVFIIYMGIYSHIQSYMKVRE